MKVSQKEVTEKEEVTKKSVMGTGGSSQKASFSKDSFERPG